MVQYSTVYSDQSQSDWKLKRTLLFQLFFVEFCEDGVFITSTSGAQTTSIGVNL